MSDKVNIASCQCIGGGAYVCNECAEQATNFDNWLAEKIKDGEFVEFMRREHMNELLIVEAFLKRVNARTLKYLDKGMSPHKALVAGLNNEFSRMKRLAGVAGDAA